MARVSFYDALSHYLTLYVKTK